jgi:hypothetical protein
LVKPKVQSMSATHEDFGRETRRSGPSNRSFGLVFTVAFLLYGLWPLRHGRPVRPAGLVLAAAVSCIAIVRPSLLSVPNRIWTKCGELMGRVVNPLVTALLFYLVFTPAAVLLRWMGKDVMGLAIDRAAKTYWIVRTASEPRSDMTNQF